MKTYTSAGLVLGVIGVVALAYQGLTYTTREKVVDLGPIQMTAEKTHSLPLPPIVGGLALSGRRNPRTLPEHRRGRRLPSEPERPTALAPEGGRMPVPEYGMDDRMGLRTYAREPRPAYQEGVG